MATLYLDDIREDIAQTYLKAPFPQRQRLKQLIEEMILKWSLTTGEGEMAQSIWWYNHETFIQHTPGVCGGEACVRQTRMPVWTLISLRAQGATDPEILIDYPGLTATDLEAAWAYYQSYREEIEQALASQDDDN
jgi:type III restriction enzyme